MNTYIGPVGAVLAVLLSLITLVASTLELTRLGRLRNQISKEVSIYSGLPDGVGRQVIGDFLAKRSALLALSLEPQHRPWTARRHPVIGLSAAALYAAKLIIEGLTSDVRWFDTTQTTITYDNESFHQIAEMLTNSARAVALSWLVLLIVRRWLGGLMPRHMKRPLYQWLDDWCDGLLERCVQSNVIRQNLIRISRS